jgi:DNA-binding response OmpR family regulator
MNDQLGPQTVIIVAEDDVIGTLCAAVLARRGFLTEHLHDPTVALERLLSSPVLVLLAVKRASELVQRIDPAVRGNVIVLSGELESGLERSLRSGVFATLHQPIDIHELGECVERWGRQQCDHAAPTPLSRPRAPLEDSLRRFDTELPGIRSILAGPSRSAQELFVRRELRQTMRDLGAAFARAASVESDATRARRLARASDSALRLSISHERTHDRQH